MTNNKWKYQWKMWINPVPVLPGVYRRKDGGFVVRATFTNPLTGKRENVRKVLPDVCHAPDALQIKEQALNEKRAAIESSADSTLLFAEYAMSLFKRKVKVGEIRSEAGIRKWRSILTLHLVPYFGRLALRQMTRNMVATWRDEMALSVLSHSMTPSTANARLGVMRVVCRAAKAEHGLRADLVEDVHDVPLGDHRIYTVDEPNSLTPQQLPEFLNRFLERYPDHYAMVALGFITGLRPSTLAPIRRSGADEDIRRPAGDLLVRRSVTYGVVMNTPKTGKDQCIGLPDEMMAILDWHGGRLPIGPPSESSLLFPSRTGGFRGHTVIAKPLQRIADDMKLGKKITPRAMRRTFNDVARVAGVTDKMTRAVSGHSTEKMQWHYSTIGRDEIRGELSKVMGVAGFAAQLPARA